MLIIYKVRTKKGSTEDFKQLVEKTLVPEAYKLAGCKLFTCYQNIADGREFILHELWDNEGSVHVYKKRLIALLGKPHSDEEFPSVMNDMIEYDEDLV